MEQKNFNLNESLNLPEEYYTIDKPKHNIAVSIKEELSNQQLSVRDFADKIDGFSYSQLSRITSKKNYNINTLLKVLHELGLEIKIQKKEQS